MAKKKSRSSFSFSGRVSTGIHKEKEKFASFSYLKLPEGMKALKIEERNYLLDILPYIVQTENHPERSDEHQLARPGDLWWRFPFRIHKGIGPNEERVVCPRTFGQPCPICEYAKQRREEGAEKDELSALYSKGRYLYAVIPVDNKKLDEEIMIWDYSYSLFEKQLDEELENDPSNDRFPGLEDGLTLEIRFREEKYGQGSYYETSRINFLERDSVYGEDILDQVPELGDCLKVLSYKELEGMFHNIDDVPEEEEDEEAEAPKASGFRKPKTNNTRRDEEPDEEEEEETPPPKTSGRTRGNKKPTKEECPHGYEFGVDNDTQPECEECDVWDRCNEASKKR